MAGPATVCTIIAKNYISFARVLCRSFLEHHPTSRCYALIIDDITGYVDPRNEPFEVLTLTDLGIPHVFEFCFKYNLLELATAVKPYLLEHLLRANPSQPVLYLDPDVLVTGSLDGLDAHFSTGDILITPHADDDYPQDGLQPDGRGIFLYGLYNLGFIGLRDRNSTNAFLEWWKGKLYNECVNRPPEGYFVDQRFLDFASIIFPNIKVVREPGCNVAWWNLHTRRVVRDTVGWYCNGNPLYFFHFSGYDPLVPDQISRHQNRFQLTDMPDLLQLFDDYRRRLLESGYRGTRDWPYTFARFRAGGKITPSVRRLYRSDPQRVTRYGDPFESKRLRLLAAGSKLSGATRKRVRHANPFVLTRALVLKLLRLPNTADVNGRT
jgi:hypothetical protein